MLRTQSHRQQSIHSVKHVSRSVEVLPEKTHETSSMQLPSAAHTDCCVQLHPASQQHTCEHSCDSNCRSECRGGSTWTLTRKGRRGYHCQIGEMMWLQRLVGWVTGWVTAVARGPAEALIHPTRHATLTCQIRHLQVSRQQRSHWSNNSHSYQRSIGMTPRGNLN